jgi:hypothetical protein
MWIQITQSAPLLEAFFMHWDLQGKRMILVIHQILGERGQYYHTSIQLMHNVQL